MENHTPTNSEKPPVVATSLAAAPDVAKERGLKYEKEFNMYVMWKVLPHYFKSPPPRKTGHSTYEPQTSDEFLDSLGVDDELLRELSTIKKQGDFAIKYDLSPDTLTDWNKLIESRNLLDDVKKWARRLSKNVVLAMYNNSLSGKNLNADRDRLNFLKFGGYVEKTGVEHSADETLTDIIKRSLIKKENGAGPTGTN